MTRLISGLAEIAGQFDGMIIDQFGVIHDGRQLYPGAAEVMAELRASGIDVVVVTNSGKRAKANVARIVKMGIAREQFVDCISSGEVAYQSLRATSAYIIGKQGEDYGFEGIALVDDPREAEVLLILASNVPDTSMDDYRALFAGLAVPAICCNPDKLMITAQGLLPAAGAIAELYASMGGHVTWIGKPYPGIYHAAKALMPRAQRVLCIGDSAEHDVAGGRLAGFSTLLVQQGVSAELSAADLSPAPDFLLPAFVWRG
jgi:HAD superfamily hydrolase (TIGR01459 family)